MQNWKKGYIFGHIDKFWNGHDAQIKKNACKNANLGSNFIPEKYVFRVCFENPFMRMISSLKYKWTPGAFTDEDQMVLPAVIIYMQPETITESSGFFIPLDLL